MNPRSAIRNQRSKWRLWVLAACLGVPLLAFGIAGTLWLYERHWLGWAGFVFLCGEALLLMLFRRWSRTGEVLLPQPPTALPTEFAPRDEEAWSVVREYLDRVDRNEITFTSAEQFISLGREILSRIASFYRPGDQEPLLSVPVPLLFRAIEETARDLATVTSDLPFAHRITIGDAVRGYRLHQKLQPAYEAYRFLRPLFNWQNALFQFFVTDRLFDVTKDTLNQWLLKWYVDRVGYHAIELYSGKLLLTQREESTAVLTPLRLLIVGQVKAGKSSLVNALFGSVQAATDALPKTAGPTPYVLQRPDLEGAILLYDMGGYEDPETARERMQQATTEALRSDLILLVISAVNAAREPDRQLLQYLQEYFTTHPELRPPPIRIVLTHIDLLRPAREWNPPYNIETPNSPKAQTIRSAVDAVATELGLQPEAVVPVCVLPERLYNVEEALVPLLAEVLPEAKRALLIRSLKKAQTQEQWQLLGRQARAAGRFLLQMGKEVVKKSVEQVTSERRAS